MGNRSGIYRIYTLANFITVVRLLAIPVVFYYLVFVGRPVLAAVLLAAIASTDKLDGFIARNFNQVTKFGKMLDPVVDRMFFVAAGVGLLIDGTVQRWVMVALLVREVPQTVYAVHMKRGGFADPTVTWHGKRGAALLMMALPVLLLANSQDWTLLGEAGLVLFGAGYVLSWWATYDYFLDYSRQINMYSHGPSSPGVRGRLPK